MNYQKMLDKAMLGIVRQVLMEIQQGKSNNEEGLYISFKTTDKAVVLSKRIREKYPSEITIVLQHQYKKLHVYSNWFEVNIAFGGVPETICVPFRALTSFVDPGANFSLQFNAGNIDLEEADSQNLYEFLTETNSENQEIVPAVNKQNPTKTNNPVAGEVIAFDKFKRKKN